MNKLPWELHRCWSHLTYPYISNVTKTYHNLTKTYHFFFCPPLCLLLRGTSIGNECPAVYLPNINNRQQTLIYQRARNSSVVRYDYEYYVELYHGHYRHRPGSGRDGLRGLGGRPVRLQLRHMRQNVLR